MSSLKHRRASAGLSLVELMVGIAVGLVVLVGLSSVYVNSVRGGRTTTASNQLNQELRALMDIMVNDIRRAGHWSTPVVGGANPFTDNTHLPIITAITSDRGCILYSYDAPAAIGTSFFGYQLTSGGVVQAVNPGSLASTAAGCGAAAWENLTDELSTQVTRLTFDTVGSKCIAFHPDTYVATDPTTYSQWSATAADALACDPSATNAPSSYPSPATHYFVETRQINIALQGRSRTDPNLPPLTLSEAVLIRTNRVLSPP